MRYLIHVRSVKGVLEKPGSHARRICKVVTWVTGECRGGTKFAGEDNGFGLEQGEF